MFSYSVLVARGHCSRTMPPFIVPFHCLHSRLSVVVLMVLSVAWIPVVVNAAGLYTYVQALTSYLACPLSALFLLAVFWPRFTERGAFWGVVVGLAIGAVRFVLETTLFTSVQCGDTPRPYFFLTDWHFLYYRCRRPCPCLLFSAISMVILS